jgi:hypothetical protein
MNIPNHAQSDSSRSRVSGWIFGIDGVTTYLRRLNEGCVNRAGCLRVSSTIANRREDLPADSLSRCHASGFEAGCRPDGIALGICR